MATISLAPKQVQLLVAVLAQLGSDQVDWKVTAEVADFKTPKYARDTWIAVKNKILADTGSKFPDISESAKAKGSKKRKVKSGTPAEADDEEEDTKPKPKKSRGDKVKKEDKEGSAGLSENKD